MHQPALCSTPTFCREVYFARMFDFYFFLNMSLACMLGPWSPKKASFCKNLLLCHFFAFFWVVFTELPILFVRNWAQRNLWPVFLQRWQKVKRSYPFFFCPRFVLASRAEILVVATLLPLTFGKMCGYERFTFCLHCKKTTNISEP